MRKKLGIALAILLLIVLSFWVWLQYRQYSSWKVPVHANIKTVARVNTDALIKKFITEYGLNFSKKIRKKEKDSSDASKNTGIYIPGNVFIYNISSRLSSTFFCTMPVHDLADFKAYAKRQFNIQLSDSAGIFKGNSADEKLMIACNADYISFAYSKDKENVMPDLVEILTADNSLAKNELYTKQLKKSQTAVVITNGLYNITADLKGKQLLVHSTFTKFRSINIPPEPKQKPADSSLNLFLSANFIPAKTMFKPEYSFKDITVETDSILKYYDGYATMEIAAATSQTDTITTYEYDDNFEKVAKQTITEVKVPAINFSFSAKPGLLAYLQSINIVTAQNKLNKEIFPLYTVTVSEAKQMIHFTTTTTTSPEPQSFVPSKNFFELNMNAKRTAAVLDIPYAEKFIKNISGLKITGHQKDGLIVINGDINFEQAAIKEMVEIIKSL